MGKLEIVIVDDGKVEKSDFSKYAIKHLHNENLAISADSLLSKMGEFYSTVLQVSLAAFVLFGFLSFLAIRWQSIQAAEDFADSKVKSSFENYTSSQKFHDLLSQNATNAFDIAAEPLEEMIAYGKNVGDLEKRLVALENQYGLNSSDAEPEEEGE